MVAFIKHIFDITVLIQTATEDGKGSQQYLKICLATNTPGEEQEVQCREHYRLYIFIMKHSLTVPIIAGSRTNTVQRNWDIHRKDVQVSAKSTSWGQYLRIPESSACRRQHRIHGECLNISTAV